MSKLAIFFAVSWLLLVVGSTSSRAEPISIAVLTAIGIQATATAVAATTFALTLAASVGLSYLQAALRKGGEQPQDAIPIGGTTGKLSAGGVVPRSFGAGTFMTGGSLGYANTFGFDGKTPNAFFVQVIALSDIPATALREVWVNGAKGTYDPNATPGPDGIAIPEFSIGSDLYLWVRFYDGTQTEADPRLVQLFGTDPDRPYTSRRIGRGIAYAIITARVSSDLFQSFPQFKFVLDGAKLYDRRFDSTAGGTGVQRWADPSTWAFTRNNAVIRENVLRGIRWDGQWQWGGQTVTDAQLPAASWFAAANECDVPIALAAVGTEPQFSAGGEIRYDTTPADVIDALLKADNGRLAEIGGVYKTRSGAPGVAVLSFTDADILSSDKQTFEPFAPQAQQINHVTGRYISAAEGWNFKDAAALVDTALEESDGRRLSTAVDYGFVTSGTQVQRLMRAERDTSRAWRRHALPMPPEAFVLEPLDVVSWTSARNGYITKTFEVISADDLPNFNMGLAVKELDPAAYDWTPAAHERPVIDGTIKLLRPAPQPIVAWFADPYTLAVGSRARAAIELGWDADTDDVDGIRFEVRLKATAALVLAGEEGLRVFEAGSLIVSQNLLPATDYQARGQYRPASSRPTLWSGWLDVTTPDTRIAQEELSDQLDAKVRQATEQLPEAIAHVRGALDDLATALNTQVSTIREAHGRSIVAIGERYEQNVASIEQVAIAFADGDQALADIITDLTATVGGNTAAIHDEQVARADGDSALAGDISDLTATVGDNAAAIHDESVARADGDSALSGRITTLLATGPGGTAEGKFRIVTSSAPSGAVASISLEVNVAATGAPNWQPAGVYLDAMLGFGRFRAIADLIKLQVAGVNGGAPFDMLTIVAGYAQFSGLLKAQNFVADTIYTAHLRADAATATAYFTAGNNSFQTNSNTVEIQVASGTVDVAVGPVSIDAALQLFNTSSLRYTGVAASIRLYIDGAAVGTAVPIIPLGVGLAGDGVALTRFLNNPAHLLHYAVLSVGSHTLALKVTAGTPSVGDSSAWTASANQIRVFESRR
jgi:putative tail protein